MCTCVYLYVLSLVEVFAYKYPFQVFCTILRHNNFPQEIFIFLPNYFIVLTSYLLHQFALQ